MKVSILDRRYIYIVGCFGPLLVPVELTSKEVKQLVQLGYTVELHEKVKSAKTKPEVKVTLDKKEITLMVGEKSTVNVLENGKVTLEDIEWTIKDKKLDGKKIKIDKKGNIEACEEGDVVISASHNGTQLMCVITVLPLPKEEVKAEPVTLVEEPVVEVPVKEETIVEETPVVEEVVVEETVVEEPVQEETIVEETPVVEEVVVEETPAEEVKVEEQPKKTTKKTTKKK